MGVALSFLSTNFFLNGNKILRQQDASNTLTFYYGADGVTGFHLSNSVVNEDFYYKKNAQNDIIGIYSTNGVQIAKYEYDAWGNCVAKYLQSDGTYAKIEKTYSYNDTTIINRFIAFKNPFRYRSYYYDFETNLYYLNSRYYDPEIGRFVNADDIATLKMNMYKHGGVNLFGYCLNNPVQYLDQNGLAPEFANFVKRYNALISLDFELFSDNPALQNLIGNISYSVTKTELSKELGFFYAVQDYYSSNFGAALSGGVGFNLFGWVGIEVGFSTSDGLYATLQLTPYFTLGVNIGQNSLGINVGWSDGEYNHNINLNISKGILSLVAVLVFAPYAIPIFALA